MTAEPTPLHEDHGSVGPQGEAFRVRIPISVSIPTVESKTSLLKTYTCYCMRINDFGRQVEVQHRFDDFAKLHEGLSSIHGLRLPALPAKAMFGGNDPKVIEERRPALERLAKECVSSEQALADERDLLCKFLDISPAGTTVVKFLCPSTRSKYVCKLVDLIKADSNPNDYYRLFNEPVLKVLLHTLSTTQDMKTMISILDVLQFILSRAHSHPLSKSVDVQKIFVSLGGITTVWSLLVTNRDVRENCRRTLSSLISSNSDQIENFENLLTSFLRDQNGLSLLFSSADDSALHDIISKLIWFGLSAEVQKIIAAHSHGLSLLGKLYSSPESNARCLAGLTLSVLVTSGCLDTNKSIRAIEGVTSILSTLVTSTTNLPSQQFLSSVCRGSSRGLERIVSCVESGDSPMSDFCSYVLLHADLPNAHSLASCMESALLRNEPQSVIGMNASRFLFRLLDRDNQLPSVRTDGRIDILMQRIRDGLTAYNKTSRKIIEDEHSQFSQFHRGTLVPRLACVKSKNVSPIDFSAFEEIVKQYMANQAMLEDKVTLSAQSISGLGEALREQAAGDASWAAIPSDLTKEWNHSLLGMNSIRAKVVELEAILAGQESRSQSANADANNLQQVLTNMREEIVAVDSRAEEFRKESSRFTAAAAGAVDPELMLQRANEFETKAKDEITRREALRQSQDSLESQLEAARKAVVEAETEASQTRRIIAETMQNVAQGDKMHAELEDRFRGELKRAIGQWNEKMTRTQNQLSSVEAIVANFNEINTLVETENEHKDFLVGIIGDLITKLQRLQTDLQRHDSQ